MFYRNHFHALWRHCHPAAARAYSTATAGKKSGEMSTAGTGFVLKLYQMVNGAPDDILCVSLLCSFPPNVSLCLTIEIMIVNCWIDSSCSLCGGSYSSHPNSHVERLWLATSFSDRGEMPPSARNC